MLFFFFKQKTAYEMRISDWSSDVCSSDLAEGADVRTLCLGVFGALGLRQVRGQDNVLRIAVGFERVFPAENENFLAAAQVVLAPEADASDVGILRARLEIVIDDVIDPVRSDAVAVFQVSGRDIVGSRSVRRRAGKECGR